MRKEEDKAKANEGMKLIGEKGNIMKFKVRRTKGWERVRNTFSGNTGTKETVTWLFFSRNFLSSWPSFKKGINLMMVSLTQIQMPT